MLGLVLRYNNALWSGVPRSEPAELWGFPVEAAGSIVFDFRFAQAKTDKNFLRKFLRPVP